MVAIIDVGRNLESKSLNLLMCSTLAWPELPVISWNDDPCDEFVREQGHVRVFGE